MSVRQSEGKPVHRRTEQNRESHRRPGVVGTEVLNSQGVAEPGNSARPRSHGIREHLERFGSCVISKSQNGFAESGTSVLAVSGSILDHVTTRPDTGVRGAGSIERGVPGVCDL